MQLRDYPHPLLDITEITVSGRMMFAEQEARERGNKNRSVHACVMEFVFTGRVTLLLDFTLSLPLQLQAPWLPYSIWMVISKDSVPCPLQLPKYGTKPI